MIKIMRWGWREGIQDKNEDKDDDEDEKRMKNTRKMTKKEWRGRKMRMAKMMKDNRTKEEKNTRRMTVVKKWMMKKKTRQKKKRRQGSEEEWRRQGKEGDELRNKIWFLKRSVLMWFDIKLCSVYGSDLRCNQDSRRTIVQLIFSLPQLIPVWNVYH